MACDGKIGPSLFGGRQCACPPLPPPPPLTPEQQAERDRLDRLIAVDVANFREALMKQRAVARDEYMNMTDTSTEIVHHVEYMLPGSFFPESVHRVVERRDLTAAKAAAPESAYRFTFYDTPPKVDLPGYRVTAEPVNRSGRFYIGGETFGVDELEAWAAANDRDMGILVSNMRANSWLRVIRCRTGNWQPFEPGDRII